MPTLCRPRAQCQICAKPFRSTPVEVYVDGLRPGRPTNRPYVLWFCRAHKAWFESILDNKPLLEQQVVELRDSAVPRLRRAELEELRAIGAWRAVDKQALKSTMKRRG